ncbi:hypothetical protein PN498_23530 [Oscillatoria sp. CS-180]|uniref:hypothetical protein n=1 Tax=Oscillatoria sp. CS-180 TaxID=3021720 RepID=UPI00232F04F6|nr:hypothetical protein [Oscillatoria sp. CS-180]MDB9528984.1 hypothetical protein [Oscillatoria sp. CS-180]
MTITAMDISGCWIGTYWQAAQPTRFEATLIQGGSVLDGRILDENYLGEAWVKGELLGSRVFFIKRYLTTSPSPIRYSGTLSEDGDYMHGNWRIGYFDSGPWEAYRAYDSLSEELSLIVAEKNAVAMASTNNNFLLAQSL